MIVLDVIGWIIVGFFAGALSGMVVRDRTRGGCLANVLIGILGGLIGGYLAQELLDLQPVYTWLSALLVAFVGAVIIRWLLALAGPRR